jgi:hypothetical protein
MSPQLTIVLMIVVSFLIGIIGRNYRFGFWGYFFSSLLLTPMVGILLVIASKPKEQVNTIKYKIKK